MKKYRTPAQTKCILQVLDVLQEDCFFGGHFYLLEETKKYVKRNRRLPPKSWFYRMWNTNFRLIRPSDLTIMMD